MLRHVFPTIGERPFLVVCDSFVPAWRLLNIHLCTGNCLDSHYVNAPNSAITAARNGLGAIKAHFKSNCAKGPFGAPKG